MGDKMGSAPSADNEAIKIVRKQQLTNALKDKDMSAKLLVVAADIAGKLKKGENVDADQVADYNTIKSMLPMEDVYNGLPLEEAISRWNAYQANKNGDGNADGQ